MAACVRCGRAIPTDARFCPGCGAPVAPTDEAAAIGSRRTVTVLFSDLVGSTALGERLDPELVRGVLARYFEAMAAVIEAHGGTVEKYVGDAIMAVFGLTRTHEDDALRAIRAAVGMRDALATLNEGLAAERGVTLAARTGLATGEVVTGDPAADRTLATGDAINTAARLEQAAGPGDILVGAATWRLVRDAADGEPVAPITAKGKAQPVAAVRLLSLLGGHRAAVARPSVAPLVGRDAELAQLEAAFDRVVRTQRPELIVAIAPPGAGKSRLVAEVMARLGGRGARVLRGRCLSYGEGITWWPVRGLLHDAAGIREEDDADAARARLRRLVAGMRDGEVIAARLATAIGLSDEPAAQEELVWAVRRTLESLAAERPLAVLVEDIHWAAPELLELLQHLVTVIVGVPLLLITPARPELRERAHGWGADPGRITWMPLDPLGDTAMDALVAAIPGAATLDQVLRSRALAIAEGNPLFIEELVRMLVEEGPRSGADVPLPPTIEAVLAARLDSLPGGERGTAQRASVVGRAFEVATVVALTPERARAAVPETLTGLARRELVIPDGLPSPVDPEAADAYRFRHILIRDAAYARLTKAERADLHERFADWLEALAGDRLTEYQEILGHHLERAWQYRTELREPTDRTTPVGLRAAGHLLAAGRRARERGEASSAVSLLERAEGLPARDAPARATILIESGRARYDAGRSAETLPRAEEALAIAQAAGSPDLATLARLLRYDASIALGRFTDTDDVALTEVTAALRDAEAAGDAEALAQAWNAMCTVAYMDGRLAEAAEHAARALTFARLAGDTRLVLEMEITQLVEAFVGPTPAAQVVDLARSILERATAWPMLRADVLRLLAPMEAMLERHAEALEHALESIAILRDLAQPDSITNAQSDLGAWVHRLRGDLPAAEAAQRAAHAIAVDSGNAMQQAYTACRLAQELVAQDRLAEAAPWLDEAERMTAITNRTRVLGMRLRIRAAAYDATAADEVPQLLALLDGTRFLNIRVDALQDAAIVRWTLGRPDDARVHLREARALSITKGNLARVRLLESLTTRLAMKDESPLSGG